MPFYKVEFVKDVTEADRVDRVIEARDEAHLTEITTAMRGEFNKSCPPDMYTGDANTSAPWEVDDAYEVATPIEEPKVATTTTTPPQLAISPVGANQLYQALRALVTPMPPADAICHIGICSQDKCANCSRIKAAHDAVKKAEEDHRESHEEANTIEGAKLLHASEDIEIDDEPAVSRGESGCWVAGWLWVEDATDDDDEEEEDDAATALGGLDDDLPH